MLGEPCPTEIVNIAVMLLATGNSAHLKVNFLCDMSIFGNPRVSITNQDVQGFPRELNRRSQIFRQSCFLLSFLDLDIVFRKRPLSQDARDWKLTLARISSASATRNSGLCLGAMTPKLTRVALGRGSQGREARPRGDSNITVLLQLDQHLSLLNA